MWKHLHEDEDRKTEAESDKDGRRRRLGNVIPLPNEARDGDHCTNKQTNDDIIMHASERRKKYDIRQKDGTDTTWGEYHTYE